MQEEKHIKQLISGLLDTYSLRVKYNETTLINNWEHIVGKLIDSQTDKLYVYKGKLFVHLKSAPLKSELNFRKKEMLDRVNNYFKEEYIADIIFR